MPPIRLLYSADLAIPNVLRHYSLDIYSCRFSHDNTIVQGFGREYIDVWGFNLLSRDFTHYG